MKVQVQHVFNFNITIVQVVAFLSRGITNWGISKVVRPKSKRLAMFLFFAEVPILEIEKHVQTLCETLHWGVEIMLQRNV